MRVATKAMNALINGITITNDTSFIDYFDEWIKVNKEDVIIEKVYATYINSINQMSRTSINKGLKTLSFPLTFEY